MRFVPSRAVPRLAEQAQLPGRQAFRPAREQKWPMCEPLVCETMGGVRREAVLASALLAVLARTVVAEPVHPSEFLSDGVV
jgi:hypothetical protein